MTATSFVPNERVDAVNGRARIISKLGVKAVVQESNLAGQIAVNDAVRVDENNSLDHVHTLQNMSRTVGLG